MKPITALEFVGILRKAGFVLTTVTDLRIAMVRDGRSVVVKRHQALTPDEISMLLVAAGVSEAEFASLAGRPLPRASGVMPGPLHADAPADDRPTTRRGSGT